jgi:predicted enzyme related to lactoylglutathione lyase
MIKQLQIYFIFLFAIITAACSTSITPNPTRFSLSNSPLLGKFVWHDLVSTDLLADKQFYQGLFGWTFEQHDRSTGGTYALAKSDNQYVAGLVAAKTRDDHKNISRWIGYLSVDDVDQAVKVNAMAGGETIITPDDMNIGRIAAVTDPKGAVLGLVRSKFGDPDDSMKDVPGRVVWDELLTNDVSASTGFYKKLLDYEVRTLKRRGGVYTILLANNVKRAGILKNPSGDGQTMWLAYFSVPDINTVVSKVEPLGGKVLISPSQDIREGSMALVTTPSGAIFAIQGGYCIAGESTC